MFGLGTSGFIFLLMGILSHIPVIVLLARIDPLFSPLPLAKLVISVLCLSNLKLGPALQFLPYVELAYLHDVVLLVLEVHACIAEESYHFHHLVSYLIRTFHNNYVLLEKALNLILLTSAELGELRSFLKKSLVVLVDVAEPRGRAAAELGVFADVQRRSCSLEGSLKLKNLFGYCETWDASGALQSDQTTELGAGVEMPRIGAIPTPLRARISFLSEGWLKPSLRGHSMGIFVGLLPTTSDKLAYNLAWRTLLDDHLQALNLILLTSAELGELRSLLKKSLVDSCGKDLFQSLYASRRHSPMATISLCLLAQVYSHASCVIQSLGEEDINLTLKILILHHL
ncbi:hypothetical protein ACP4OV_010519 [Aristida adscensionis]